MNARFISSFSGANITEFPEFITVDIYEYVT
jgi:hypothetical protein